MKKTVNNKQLLLLYRSPLLFGILAAIIAFIVSISVIEQRRNIKLKENSLELTSEMKRINKKLNDFFDDMYSALAAITRTIDKNGDVQDFDKIATDAIKNSSYSYNLSLIPYGVIKYAYPDKSGINKSLLNQVSEEEKAEILATLHSRKIKIAGPFKNTDNIDCIAARLPVFINGSFWGFSSVVARLEDLLKATDITDTSSSKYDYSIAFISHINNKEVFFFNKAPDLKGKNHLEDDVMQVRWKFYIYSKNTNYNLFLVPAMLSLIGSLLIGFAVKKIFERPLKLQSVIYEKEKRIAEAEKEFKVVFDNAPIGLAIIEPHSNRLSVVNKRLVEIFDFEDKQLSDVQVKDLVGKEVYEKFLSKIPHIVSKNESEVSGESKHLHKNGQTIYTHSKIFTLPGNDETDFKYVIITQDITEKKLADEKLAQSERKYRHLFNESPIALWEEDFSDIVQALSQNGLLGKKEEDAIAFFDAHPQLLNEYIKRLKITSFNDECVRQFKLNSKEELLSGFWYYTSHPGNITVMKKILAAICSGSHKYESESTFYDSQGILRSNILSWQVIPGHEENYDQIILTTVDITDFKKSKAELEATTTRLRLLVDTIDGVVWTADPATLTYTFVSKKITDITGYTTWEWMGQSILHATKKYTENKEDISKILEHQIREGEKFEAEFMSATKNGDTKWYRESIDFIKDENGAINNIIGILVDITDLRHSKKDLQDSLEISHHQNKRLMDFSYIVSHNLRSHTSNIQSLCDLILTSSSSKEKEELTASLYSVVNILSSTMSGLNEVINFNSDINVTKQSINLSSEIDNTINILNDKIKQKEAVILNNVPKQINIFYNKSYIESILLNLISNSLKYSKPTVCPIVSISYTEHDDQKVLIITDNGIGIDLEKNRHKLFGLFKTFTHNPDSKGVGLYITKRQVETMGGEITVDSKPGEGTSFKIYFR